MVLFCDSWKIVMRRSLNHIRNKDSTWMFVSRPSMLAFGTRTRVRAYLACKRGGRLETRVTTAAAFPLRTLASSCWCRSQKSDNALVHRSVRIRDSYHPKRPLHVKVLILKTVLTADQLITTISYTNLLSLLGIRTFAAPLPRLWRTPCIRKKRGLK